LDTFTDTMTTADALSPAPPVETVGSAVRSTVCFLGDTRAYWRLLIKGAALLMVTLGIYRFWLATDVRRFLWSNTEIAGETLEYNGLATELLLGFLIAIAILVPLYTIFFIAAIELGAVTQASTALGFLLLALLGHFAVYRARRYRLTRTIFRGLRFNQRGSAWLYALVALAWWMLIALTLGLAYPWAQASLQRYKMRRTSYGDLHGSFTGSGSRLFVRGLPMWLLVMGPLLTGLATLSVLIDWDALNNTLAQGGQAELSRIEKANPKFGLAITVGMATIGVTLLAVMLLYPVFQAMMLRWWTSGLQFGPLTVTSHLRTGPVYRVYVRFLCYVLLFTLLAVVAGTVCLFVIGVLLRDDQHSSLAEYLATMIFVGGYVVAALGFSTIYQVVVKLGLWRLAAETAELSGAIVLESVNAAGAPSSAVGEGLADALNVGGI
jgi:uncharacterized membrane protein YjgN (DUF898 family)